MSLERIETAKRLVDAWNGTLSDPGSGAIGSVYDLFDEDFRFVPAVAGQIDGVTIGRDGFASFSGELAESWETFRIEPSEFRDLGDRIVVVGQVRAKGRGSGLAIDQELDSVFWFHGKKVLEVRSFLNLEEALSATREVHAQGGF